jgi:two-component system sensor histidine kinase SenX3
LGDVQTIHIAEVINEAIDREAKAASKKNIRVAAAGADDALVYGEHSLLVTALRNLIDNAINYSRPNTRVGIGVNEKGGFVEITVVDQGIGIGSAEQTRVFERFYRGEQARALVQQGTGLGLALVKHIAADHGGEITVWSQPNRGSTFTLKLPAADVTGVGPGAIETPGVRETPKAAKDRQNRAFTKPSPSVEKPVIADRLGETETSR